MHTFNYDLRLPAGTFSKANLDKVVKIQSAKERAMLEGRPADRKKDR